MYSMTDSTVLRFLRQWEEKCNVSSVKIKPIYGCKSIRRDLTNLSISQ